MTTGILCPPFPHLRICHLPRVFAIVGVGRAPVSEMGMCIHVWGRRLCCCRVLQGVLRRGGGQARIICGTEESGASCCYAVCRL